MQMTNRVTVDNLRRWTQIRRDILPKVADITVPLWTKIWTRHFSRIYSHKLTLPKTPKPQNPKTPNKWKCYNFEAKLIQMIVLAYLIWNKIIKINCQAITFYNNLTLNYMFLWINWYLDCKLSLRKYLILKLNFKITNFNATKGFMNFKCIYICPSMLLRFE